MVRFQLLERTSTPWSFSAFKPATKILLVLLTIGLLSILFVDFGAGLHSQATLSPGSSPHKVYSHKAAQRTTKRALHMRNGNVAEICTNGKAAFRLIIMALDDVPVLEKLFTQLLDTNYYGCRVHLQFIYKHSDDGKSAAFIDQLQWPHGRIHSFSHGAGQKDDNLIRNSIVPTWTPVTHNEFALIIEDPKQLWIDKEYFHYILKNVAAFFIDENSGERVPSVVAKRIAGLGFGTIPEAFKEYLTTTDMIMAQRAFGCFLATPWFWKKLLIYHDWRVKNSLEQVLESHIEGKSLWRRFMQEYMLLGGFAFLYSKEQQLISNEPIITPSVITLPKTLGDIKIIDYYGNTLTNVNMLQINNALIDSKIYSPSLQDNDYCIMDYFSSPVKEDQSTTNRRKYLMYEPHGTIPVQIETLQKVMVIAGMLNRTLIVPPIVDPAAPNKMITARMIYQHAKVKWVKTTQYHQFPFSSVEIPRHALFRVLGLRFDLMMKLESPLLKDRRIPIGERVMLPLLWNTENELYSMFAGCQDSVLTWPHMLHSLNEFQEPEAQEKFEAIQQSWSLHRPLFSLLQELRQLWGQPNGCAIYSRGIEEKYCGHEIVSDASKGVLYFRNCQAPPLRLADYTVEAGKKQNTTINSVYIMMEASANVTWTEKAAGVRVLRLETLMEAIRSRPQLGIPENLLEMAAKVLEVEYCQAADVFLNNIYSMVGKRITEKRQKYSLPIHHLGDK